MTIGDATTTMINDNYDGVFFLLKFFYSFINFELWATTWTTTTELHGRVHDYRVGLRRWYGYDNGFSSFLTDFLFIYLLGLNCDDK